MTFVPTETQELSGEARPTLIRPLRLAVFSYGLPRHGQQRGGIERVAHDLANGLAQRGHEVVVWTHDPKPGGASYRVAELPWKSFATSALGRRLTMGYLGNLLAVLPRYGEVDAIIAHGDSLLLPLRGRRLLRVMHGSALAEAMTARSPWRCVLQAGVYLQEIVTAATQRYCIGVSENCRRWNPFVRNYIPNGVDLRTFFPDPGAKTPYPSILFVGAWGGRKRGAELQKWFHQHVRPRHPQAELDMVCRPGPPSPGVNYHTGLTDSELAALYRRAWVYASPSRYEGFGLPYLEAMASGTPVLATPNPGSRELLGNGEFGLLASDREFADRLAQLLDNEQNRRQLADRGLRRALDYSLSRTIDRYEQLLCELCKK